MSEIKGEEGNSAGQIDSVVINEDMTVSVINADIAKKMYEARTAVIAIQGEDGFKFHVNEFKPILKNLCENHNVSEMEATISILVQLKGNDTATLLAMAACTEIMEPSLSL